ncbi:MAG: Gfo/Idh/MocA family oxidoreductase [Kiritimatiellaeota bacterium]|nr:Gfo/Idh/MocA family oxidoreductase [Kiritimatiellota bacterium]
MQRREFMKNAALAGAGLLIAPSGTFGATGTNNKLNIALIGSWGRGEAHFSSIATENVVALCDINDDHLAFGAKRFPQAKTYNDWRKLLDDHKTLGLDAVVICTADHTHAFVANWALNRNLHVYCEKPLAVSVEEARTVRANWLSKKAKLATQVGMQRHAISNFNRIRELILDGAIGELKSASAWGNRQCRPDLCDYDQEKGIVYFKDVAGKPVAGYLPDAGEPPKNLHYDLWLGPSPAHAYNPGYFSRGPGANCLSWNMFWDFGAGQIGDMGSHTMDLLWNCVDAKLPTSAEAKGDPFNAALTPIKCESHFEHPANDWRGPITVAWYQGGAMPTPPKDFIDLKKIGHGAMFKGSQGFLVADFDNRILFPYGKEADMTYYKARPKDKLLPPLGHFQQQWIDACKNPSLKTACDFEYSGNMIEQLLLGLVAYRAGKKLVYDGATGKITNVPEANALLSRKYRDGWVLNG